MINEQKVRDALSQLEDPFLHRSFAETNAITNVSIKEEKITLVLK